MKKMYTFTLDDVEVASDSIKSDLQLIAYMLYEELANYGLSDDTKILVNNKTLKYNVLHDKPISDNQYSYFFESNYSSIDYRLFEPCLLSDTSFGITVNSDAISDEEIYDLLKTVLGLLNNNCKITLNSITYESENNDDESQRFVAIDKFMNVKTNSTVQSTYTLKKRYIKPLWGTLIRSIGR